MFINGNISYNNNITYISNADTLGNLNTQKNIAKNLVFTQGARVRVSITDVIDAEVNGSYSINHSVNSIPQANVNNNFRTINLGVNGKNYFWKNWTLSYDYSKTIYDGYVGGTNPNIFNTYVERRFLKNNVGTLRLTAFDLFNQNTGFSSTQNGSQISQINRQPFGQVLPAYLHPALTEICRQRPNTRPRPRWPRRFQARRRLWRPGSRWPSWWRRWRMMLVDWLNKLPQRRTDPWRSAIYYGKA